MYFNLTFFSLLFPDSAASLGLFDQHRFGRLPDQGRNAGNVFLVGFPDPPLHLFRGDLAAIPARW